MEFKWIAVALYVAGLLHFNEASSSCPSGKIGSYCNCRYTNVECESDEDSDECDGYDLYCINWGDNKPSEFDIIEYFDRVSTLIQEDNVFVRFKLSDEELKEIPAGTFKTLKSRRIDIWENFQLENIHPDAFGETLDTTTDLRFQDNDKLTNNEGPEYKILNIVKKFKNLKKLTMKDPIDSLPDNAFESLSDLTELSVALKNQFNSENLTKIGSKWFEGLPKLKQLDLALRDIPLPDHLFESQPSLKHLTFEISGNGTTGTKKLGSKPFAGLHKLDSLKISMPDTPLEEIPEDLFEGVGKHVDVELGKFQFGTLPEKIFKPLLDNVRKVEIAWWLDDGWIKCNEESSWICKDVPKYRKVLEGFNCQKDSGFTDIFDYCEKVVNKN